ncbi:hypothetical protein FE782_28265 [Paenibacillus antri]|uniref:Nitrile hydratase subunit beta n=1 Tax=Paenibacillus antri TaxID=2582848 RepID=A0A5R9G1L1_9BACL|nr:hypothetical protein [Paenibacillus antri]TLS48899.1 hypothetical protein FE782_28265 [Paenibacillus antri]
MKPTRSAAWDQVQTMAQIADLKESLYRNTLALSALIELLVEKGILAPEDFHRKTAGLEREDEVYADMRRYDSSTVSHSVDRS